MGKKDDVVPKEKWVFDSDVADCFEDMLERSIPFYDVMRDCCTNLVYDVLRSGSSKRETFEILDLGCSDGLMLEHLIKRFCKDSSAFARYVGVDISSPMLEKARQRFSQEISNGVVRIEECDLRYEFPYGRFCAVTSILCLQFIPIEYRQRIIQNVYKSLTNTLDCFIMVEKVLGNTSDLDELMVKNYYRYKEQNGYSKEQIDRKKLSLEGVLVPITSDWNIDLLKQAGFREVDVFWRWMNFVGYIAIK